MAVTVAGRPPAGVRRAAPPLMDTFLIEGGVPLSGTVVPAGNKNGALPILAATLLTEEEVVVRNVPRIRDVQAQLELIQGLGVRAEWIGDNEILVHADEIPNPHIAPRPSRRARRAFPAPRPPPAR